LSRADLCIIKRKELIEREKGLFAEQYEEFYFSLGVILITNRHIGEMKPSSGVKETGRLFN